MAKLKVLVVCQCNLNRSPTVKAWLEAAFPEHEFKDAGLSYGYPNLLSMELLNWADIILTMDMEQYTVIRLDLEHCASKKLRNIHCLGISDQYERDDPQLWEILDKMEVWYQLFSKTFLVPPTRKLRRKVYK